MNIKNIYAYLILSITALFIYSFILPFKTIVVDNAEFELGNLSDAFVQASTKTTLKSLQLKMQSLDDTQVGFLKTFIPASLHSGQFVYNLGQLANQNGLILKGLQYSVVDDVAANNKTTGEKKLLVEFTIDGRYESFIAWLSRVEKSNVLVDIESIRGAKNSLPSSDIISFSVKMYAYGQKID